VLFIDRNQKNTGLDEYFRSICHPRERIPSQNVSITRVE